MESASSSKSKHLLRMYDVRINFSGEEIRRKFVSHLDSALSDTGLNTFLDEENLVKGMHLEELTLARDMSRVAIVVFTKKYLKSSWCLDELAKIIEWQHTYCRTVLPVFYEIHQFEVRHQKGDFEKALKRVAEERFSGEQLEYALTKWRRSLTKAASFFGWDESNHRNDAVLVDTIVKGVLQISVLSTTKFPVGLQSRVDNLIGRIENQSTKVSIIGIWGMGGIGKTTTAKAIYNQIHDRFMGKSFIEDVNEVAETKGLVHLQEQLLSDVLKTKIPIQSIQSGTTMIKGEFSGKRVLIVLDDVMGIDQLNVMCGSQDWFGQGSVIIITSRDRSLLTSHGVDALYNMNSMSQYESLELLSWHAFGEAKPREDFNELSRVVVGYCGGVPLLLEVLGSYLFRRTKKEWKSVLSRLNQMPYLEVQNTLEISFDGLNDHMEKDIFLDVCCFFIGEDRANVTEILNGCGLHADVGMSVLIERCLIKVDKYNKLRMHGLLQDMGREIIRERSPKSPGKRNRLWYHMDVHDVLTSKTGTEAIEGLSLKLNSTINNSFKACAFEEMEKLRLLKLDNVQLDGNYGYLSKQLRWICWQGFPSKYIPNNFYLEGVIAIELKSSQLKIVWKEPQVLGWLKILNLSHSRYLTETPDFSGLPSLEKLILKDCPRLCKVHQSIGDLCNLLLINFKDCTSLNNLPKEIYKLKSLKTLILSGCSKIDILRNDIVQMESLIILTAENTAVKEVPFSILSSKSIGYISLHKLYGLEGWSHNVFPSIIRSWMSPTMNLVSFSCAFCKDIENKNWGDLVPLFRSLSNLRSVFVQDDTVFQLSIQVKSILVEYGLNFSELGISKNQLNYSLIGIGCYKEFFDTLSASISKVLTTNESCDVSLPGDNDPYWLAHMGEGHSVYFTVPEDCPIKGMNLCVVYLSTPENTAIECLTSFSIVNYTKCTIQIYKRDTIVSFNDEEWQDIVSNWESGDKIEIIVTFGYGLKVKKMALYLMCGESNDMETETLPDPKENVLIRFIRKIVTCDFW